MKDDHLNREFDDYAADYSAILDKSLALSGYDPGYFDEYKVREMRSVISKRRKLAGSLKILNFGCGIGKSEPFIAQYFPASSIFSTDVSSESIRIARERNRALANVTFAVSDGSTIPFEGSCDLIFCAGVFHHIPQEQRQSILANLREKLSPGGILFIFEHNPWNPLTRRIVASCPLDVNAHLVSAPDMVQILRLAGFNNILRRFIIFFPRLLRFLNPLERLLGACPLGAQYYIMASRQAA
jgi:SAM-dependent methyltransferase